MSTTLATAMARLSGIELSPRAAERLADMGRAWDVPAVPSLERELELLGA